jgi:hypothetical protein
VYTGDSGFMMEHTNFSHLLRVNNTIPGDFNPNITSAWPSDFRQNATANYTLTFSPVNYEQGMQIVITLPRQINFTNQTMICMGLAGTDYTQLKCNVDKLTRSITISDAVTY